MTENHELNNDALENVAGGSCFPTPKFNPGDKVTLCVYPEYGVGTVFEVHRENKIWMCRAQFSAGEVTAYEGEFLPA